MLYDLFQCGDNFLQFYLDLCVFAINVDKGCWEKLKDSSSTGPNEEIVARKRDMAQVILLTPVISLFFSLFFSPLSLSLSLTLCSHTIILFGATWICN